MNDENAMTREYDWWVQYQKNNQNTTSSLLEIRNEIARLSDKLEHCFPLPLPENRLLRDAYPQIPRHRMNYPFGSDTGFDQLSVVLATYIPQPLNEDIAFNQIVTLRYLNAHTAIPMLAKNDEQLFPRPSGFLNRRAMVNLARPVDILGDVFWVSLPMKQKSWFALPLDNIDEGPGNLRAKIEPQIRGQFTVEQFGEQFVLCFETERDRIAAKMYLG